MREIKHWELAILEKEAKPLGLMVMYESKTGLFKVQQQLIPGAYFKYKQRTYKTKRGVQKFFQRLRESNNK